MMLGLPARHRDDGNSPAHGFELFINGRHDDCHAVYVSTVALICHRAGCSIISTSPGPGLRSGASCPGPRGSRGLAGAGRSQA